MYLLNKTDTLLSIISILQILGGDVQRLTNNYKIPHTFIIKLTSMPYVLAHMHTHASTHTRTHNTHNTRRVP
jgi:hypothetical protein